MDYFLKRKLAKIADQASPDPLFVRTLETRFRQESGVGVQVVPMWRLAAVGVTSLGLLLSCTGVFAYTSDYVLPGTALYPIRMVLEQAEETLATTPSRKTKVLVKQVQKRIKENELMKKEKRPVEEDRIRMVTDRLENVIDQTAELPESNQESVDNELDSLAEVHEQAIKEAKDAAVKPEDKAKMDELLHREKDRLRNKIEKLDLKRRANFHRILDQKTQRIERSSPSSTDTH